MIEKRCKTLKSLTQEYGKQIILNGCAVINDGREHFCICAYNECNKETIKNQVKTMFQYIRNSCGKDFYGKEIFFKMKNF